MLKKILGTLAAGLLLATVILLRAQNAPVAPTTNAPVVPSTPMASAATNAGARPPALLTAPPVALLSTAATVTATNSVATNLLSSISTNGVQLNFRDATLDQLLSMYGDLTGRTVIKGPQLAAVITLRSQNPLTVPEAVQALESTLALNGIALVPMGPKFSKATKSDVGRQESLALQRGNTSKPIPETDQLVSFIINLKYMEIDEATPILQNILHIYGKIQPLDRANSLLITDTSANIQRIQEILEFMDQPPEARVETKVYPLKNGSATDIAAQLSQLLDDSQSTTGRTQRATTPTQQPPFGFMRPPQATPQAAATESALADRGLIQGRVKILFDDRTNILIIIARPSNFPFFEKLIKVLDQKVEPETVVRVVPLSWADADQIAGILNDMLGSSGGSYGVRGGTPGGGSSGGSTLGSSTLGTSGTSLSSGNRTTTTGSRTSTSSSGTRSASSSPRSTTGNGNTAGVTNPFGNNPPNSTVQTRVMADLRSNSLLVIGTKEDIADLEEVITKLDVMLSQVLIEAIILEVDISKTTALGVNWLQRSMLAYNQTAAGQVNQQVAAFGGGWNGGTAAAALPNGASVGNGFSLPPGLNYYTTISGLNLDAVIQMVNNSSVARVLSTPVIMATDNGTAEIINTEEYPVITSSTILTTGTGGTVSTYEYKDIGIDLAVTPHINPNRMVVMNIVQSADTIASSVTVDGNSVPVINKRQITGLIAVEDRTTVVLGGLIQDGVTKARSSIPILGDIPLLGRLFRSDSNSVTRTELLVLITPYVIKTPDEARAETKRLHLNSQMSESLIRGWSDSPLARTDPMIEKATQKRSLFGKSTAPVATNVVPTTATATNATSAAGK